MRVLLGGRAHAGMGEWAAQADNMHLFDGGENPMTTGKENNAKLARRFRLVTMVSSSPLQPF